MKPTTHAVKKESRTGASGIFSRKVPNGFLLMRFVPFGREVVPLVYIIIAADASVISDALLMQGVVDTDPGPRRHTCTDIQTELRILGSQGTPLSPMQHRDNGAWICPQKRRVILAACSDDGNQSATFTVSTPRD